MELDDLSIRERAKKYKEKEEEKTPVVEQPKPVQEEPDIVKKVEESVIEVEEIEISPQDQFNSNLPPWVNKPWVYITPKVETQVESWIESWAQIIITYAETLNKHVVNSLDLQKIHPFRHQKTLKQLSASQMNSVIDEMVAQKRASYLDESKTLVRIYFKSLKEWAEIIYKYLVDSGKLVEVLTLYEFQTMKQEWSELPIDDFKWIFNYYVQENRAKFIGKDNDTVEFDI